MPTDVLGHILPILGGFHFHRQVVFRGIGARLQPVFCSKLQRGTGLLVCESENIVTIHHLREEFQIDALAQPRFIEHEPNTIKCEFSMPRDADTP